MTVTLHVSCDDNHNIHDSYNHDSCVDIQVIVLTLKSVVMTFITFMTVLMTFMTVVMGSERMSAQVTVSTGHGFRSIKHPTKNFYNNFSQYTTNDRFLTYCYYVDCLENAVYLKQMPLLPV